MNKPVITVKNISKSYNISHEMKASAGTVTFRDAIINTLKKPKELLTGHLMKKEKFWALKGLDFEINKGEVVGIIGKNGSGKSTLLKIMSRITEPTTGEIVMNGRVASLLEVGTGFHPELTGRENVYFNGSILGMKKKEIDAKFDEIVAFSEVEKFLDTPVKFYSSGMYVRLAFAVAAHLDPDILIVDEVLAVGDAAFQKKCLGKMRDVAGGGRTVIYVSHNMDSVQQLCNKIVWIDKGKIVADSVQVRKTLDRYMLDSGQSAAAPEWKNTGKISNDIFSIKNIKLYSGKNKITSTVGHDKEVSIRIEGVLNKNDKLFNVGYSIYSPEGLLLYWSVSTDDKKEIKNNYRKGPIVFETTIPRNFLNEGDYRVQVFASLHNKEWILDPNKDAPSVLLSVRGGFEASDYWLKARPGAIAPELNWRVI
jgi:lipopolysaccharide transport system ATP-binding protein